MKGSYDLPHYAKTKTHIIITTAIADKKKTTQAHQKPTSLRCLFFFFFPTKEEAISNQTNPAEPIYDISTIHFLKSVYVCVSVCMAAYLNINLIQITWHMNQTKPDTIDTLHLPA